MERSAGNRMAVVLCVLVTGLCASVSGRIIYVDDDAAGANNGSSWASAFTHLQDALEAAQAGDEIRVAQGIYKPDRGAGITPDDREATFYLVSGVTHAGGYAGLGGADPDARDIERYETILSGDLNGDDGPDFTNMGDNSMVVVSSLGNDAATTLEGFTITGGWGVAGPGITALGSDLRMEHCTLTCNKTRGTSGDGAGMYSSGGSPVLKHCVFSDNLAYGNGGGLYSQEDAVTLERCTFRGNNARYGGGIYVIAYGKSQCFGCRFINNTTPGLRSCSGGGACISGSAPATFDGSGPMLFRDCLFEGNAAGQGGGLVGWGDFALSRCRFTDNEADEGGALYYSDRAPQVADCQFTGNLGRNGGGAVYARGGGSRRGGGPASPGATFARCRFAGNVAYHAPGGGLYNAYTNMTLLNCLIAGNVADDGGGMFSRGATPMLTHCTLTENRGGLGSGLLDDSGGSILDHCIVWKNEGDGVSGAALIIHSDVEGGWPGAGNIDVDPCFASPGHWEYGGTHRDWRDDVWVDGDYHLKSQAGRWDPDSESWVQDDVTSPCIDAGDPMSSVGDEPFPNGGIVNLGAYGGTTEASKTYFGVPLCETHLVGDINGDCRVDVEDLLILVAQWTDGASEPSAVAIVEPADGAVFEIGTSERILIRAVVSDPDFLATEVRFTISHESEGLRYDGSFSARQGEGDWYLEWYWWNHTYASGGGDYTITATAYDSPGRTTVSTPVVIAIDPQIYRGR